jgi:hypothetical protein
VTEPDFGNISENVKAAQHDLELEKDATARMKSALGFQVLSLALTGVLILGLAVAILTGANERIITGKVGYGIALFDIFVISYSALLNTKAMVIYKEIARERLSACRQIVRQATPPTESRNR